MQYQGTLLAVRDMTAAKQFYQTVFGLHVQADFGANVMLEGGIYLQTMDTWPNMLGKAPHEVVLRSHWGELYFEEEEIEAFVQRLRTLPEIQYVHPLREHSWGQRVVRVYDPDGHIVEVGESLRAVARRFAGMEMSAEQIANRMDVPVDFLKSLLAEREIQPPQAESADAL